MAKNRKFWILIAAALTMVALFLLASSLSTVELLPGQRFPWGLFMGDAVEAPLYPPMEGGDLLMTVFRIAMLVSLPLILLYMLLTKDGRKRAVRLLLQLVLIFYLMSFLSERLNENLVENPEIGMSDSAPMEEMVLEAPPEFVPGDMQDLTTALSLGLAIVLTIVIVTTLYILWRRRRLAQDDTLTDLAREAQDALDDIQAGGNLRNAVIRCYAEMSRVISEKRNIQRGITMTSHEFVEQLVKAGLPQRPVHELTHLFEEARYGDRDPGPAEEQRAVACLSTIVTAVAELAR
jgi:hypothetical protein